LPIELPAAIERRRKRIAAQLIEQRAVVSKTPIADEGIQALRSRRRAVESVETVPADLQVVDVGLPGIDPAQNRRREQLGLWAMQQRISSTCCPAGH